jgi:hypothetical protein
MRSILCIAASMLVCTACSAEEQQPGGEASDAASPPPSRPAVPGVVLLPILTAEELEGAALPGELGCAFVEDGATGPVLIAAADVLDDAYAEAVMRLGMAVEPVRMRATRLGGFNAMVKGAEFVDGEFFVRIVTTSDTPLDDSEAPPLPARMEFGTADSGTQIAIGQWFCGP